MLTYITYTCLTDKHFLHYYCSFTDELLEDEDGSANDLKVQSYVRHLSNDEFHAHFRMERSTFQVTKAETINRKISYLYINITESDISDSKYLL